MAMTTVGGGEEEVAVGTVVSNHGRGASVSPTTPRWVGWHVGRRKKTVKKKKSVFLEAKTTKPRIDI